MLKNLFFLNKQKTHDETRAVVELPAAKLKNCEFLHNRYSILEKLKRNAVAAEVGVLAGDFSEAIMKACKPRELHLIDYFNCPDYKERNRFSASENADFVQKRFSREIEEGNLKMHKGCSWKVLEQFPKDYFDWIYIDAGHDYESVRKDLEQANRLLKNDGMIIMNDYILYDHISHIPYGVVQATNEFIIANKFEMAYFAFHPQLFCDVAIKRSNPRARR